MLHDGVALSVRSGARSVQCGSARVDKVDDAAGSASGEFLAGNTLHSLGTPVCAHVREDLGATREEVVEEHSHTVAGVVLRSENDRLTSAVPVE